MRRLIIEILIERINHLRIKLQTSFYAIEKGSGIGIGSIRRWGESPPSIEKILKLAEYLDTSIDFLLGRSDDPLSHKSVNRFKEASLEFKKALSELSGASTKFDSELQRIVETFCLEGNTSFEDSLLEQSSTELNDSKI